MQTMIPSLLLNRRALLLLPLLAPAAARAQGIAAAPSPRDRADLARIETYLDGLRSLKARFLQVAPDGSTAEGTAWLERPGRMRFEYDPPSPLLMVAGHGLFFFHDSQLRQTTNLPLSATPLGLLLRDNLRLSGDVTVTGVSRLPGQIQVAMVRTNSPQDGSLSLVFADNPLQLRQWSVVDSRRQETRVTLFDIRLGGSFDPKLFTFTPQDGSGQPNGGG
ncbi:Outer membrane lipoprotein carrier protein LolA [Rhodovastum atsumiense]|uniref:Outer membrane lipoprotein carrier protein LolA n=1 Tax=Rhodovastum atsumiense TaxID=504468 RepID=A0A5M6ITP6_9PROT|nr:outer-membrane lipoprotein carrier protein LolA [Rhodovastum atsumiense]KAA5610918.1 outer membrane lipoprotein carrier protein LolA [Rhodovastum atsumiense]CAH2601513.1 Outer membrane lipoprotein carrier protein LolA [Rhodovastum atsumiense]